MNSEDFEELNASVYYIWGQYPQFIEWKLNHRNENSGELRRPINISIIIDCTTLIEGFLVSILQELFYKKRTYRDKLKSRLLDNLEAKLNNAQWTEYIRIFELIIGKSVKTYIGNENWKSISVLFSFRNQLTHGANIEFQFGKKNSKGISTFKVPGKYQTIFSYGDEKKLIEIDLITEDIDILSNKFIDHFYSQTKEFILLITEMISKEDKEFISHLVKEAFNYK